MPEPTNPLYLNTRELCPTCDTVLETYQGKTRPCPFGHEQEARDA